MRMWDLVRMFADADADADVRCITSLDLLYCCLSYELTPQRRSGLLGLQGVIQEQLLS